MTEPIGSVQQFLSKLHDFVVRGDRTYRFGSAVSIETA